MITNPEKISRMGSRDKYLSHGIAKAVRCLCICKCKEFEFSHGGGVDLRMNLYSTYPSETVICVQFILYSIHVRKNNR